MILALYGAGAMGRELMTIAREDGIYSEIVFIDDYKSGEVCRCPVYSFHDFKKLFSPDKIRFVTAFGEPRFRKESFEKMKLAGYTGGMVKHPSAYLSPDARIGEGAAFCQNAFVGSLVKIGDNFHGSVRCTVGHDAVIGDHVRVGAGAFIGGHTIVGNGAFLGSGSMLKDRISFGSGSVAALGSAVFMDVPDNATVMGNPARIADENRQGLLYAPVQTLQNADESDNSLSKKAVVEKYWDVFSKVFEGIDFNPVSFRFHDEGWESVMQMSLIASLEEAFGITLKGREVLKVRSYESGLDIVLKKLEEKKG